MRKYLSCILTLSILSPTLLLKTFAFAGDDSAGALGRSEKSVLLQNEASNLIDELMRRNYSGSNTGTPSRAATAVERPAAQVKLIPAKKKGFWPWLNAGNDRDYFKDRKPSEGEGIYKVAVSDGKITLAEAKEIGLANNSAVLAAKKKIEVAQAKLMEAKRAMFPTAQFALEESSGLASTQPSDPTHARYYQGRSYKFNVSQPVFYGGELVYTVRQAEEGLKAAKADHDKTKAEFLLQIETAYYGVLKAEYNVKYQIELYDSVVGIRNRVKEEYSQKLISEIDYLNAESQYQEVFFQIESAQNDYRSADLVLHQSVYLNHDLPMPIDLRLHFEKFDVDLDEMLTMALQTNPDIRSKEFAAVAADYGVKVYKAKKLPRVDLRGSFGYLGEIFKDTDAVELGKADLDLEREWFLGVQTSMPIGPNSVSYQRSKNVYGPTVLALTGSEAAKHHFDFNLFDRFAEITDEKSAQAAYLQALADLDKAKSDLTLKLREDIYNLQKSLIQIDSSIAKLRYQDKQNRIQEYLLSLAETTAAAYIQGLVEETQYKFSFIQAVADYRLSLSDLGSTIGDPYYFAGRTYA